MHHEHPLYEELHEKLSVTITHVRGDGTNAGAIADKILSNDAAGTLLAGITQDGTVVSYDRSMWTIYETPITDEGDLDGMGKSRITGDVRSVAGLEAWLMENQGDLLWWVHPRFRWIHNENYTKPSNG